MKKITLTSGKQVEIEQPKGKHLRKAMIMAGNDTSKLQFGIICQVAKIDGKLVAMEDIDEMSMADVVELMAAVNEDEGK